MDQNERLILLNQIHQSTKEIEKLIAEDEENFLRKFHADWINKSPKERLEQRYNRISEMVDDMGFKPGMIERVKKLRPDLMRKWNAMMDSTESMFQKLFIDEMWEKDYERRWNHYEQSCLIPLINVHWDIIKACDR